MIKHKLNLACLLCAVTLLATPLGGFAATSWNITTFSGTNNSIVGRPTPFVTGDTLNFQNNITATGAIGSLGAFLLNVTGNNYTLDANNSNRLITAPVGSDYRFDGINLNRFTGNPNGGALYNNSVVTLTNTGFNNNSATNNGGAIYNDANRSLGLTNSNFDHNTANLGGAIFNAAVVTTSGGTYTSNSATSSGGAIYNGWTANITGGTFSHNSSYHGGAIYNDRNATINGGTYTSNSANSATSEGGAIYNNGTATITDVVFNLNTSNNCGGAISNRTGKTLGLTNSNFDQNRSNLGGAIYNTGGTVTINGGTYSNNIATSTGGAIWGSGGTIKITNGNFTNNSAATNGGAIFNSGTLRIIADNAVSTFSGNTANGVANDIYMSSGTVYLNAGNGGSITLDGGINSASKTRILSINSTTGSATLTNGTININGGITKSTVNVYNGVANFGNSSILDVDEDNVAFNITGGTQTFTNSGFGGGSRISLNDVTPTVSESTNLIGSNFYGSSYIGSGGAINVASGTLNVNTSYFWSYVGTSNGGALYNAGTATISGGTYTSNYSDDSGGAIYNSGTATITNSNFTSNSANTSGGAIFNNVASLNIDNSSFDNNFSANGGAIYNSGTTTITNGNFTNNSSTSNGGAIYNSGTLKIIADNATSTFSGNTAAGLSNAIYNTGTINLNAGNGGQIIFDDKIASSAISNIININSGATFNTGEVIFNENVSNSTINLEGGTLTLGQDGNTLLTNSSGNPAHSYLDNVNLNLNVGTLNISNNNAFDVLNVNNFTSTASALLSFDADLSNNQNDTINATSASGVLNIGQLHILAEGDGSTLTLFTGGIAPTLNAFNSYSSDYKYYFTPGDAGIYDYRRITLSGLNFAVDDDVASRSFSATHDTNAEYHLGTMAGANSTLDIFGNHYNIDGIGYSGVTVLAGQTINIDNVGSLNSDNSVKTSFKGFESANGGVINNSGTINILNSVFSDNTATSKGGAIYNNGVINVVGDNGITSFSGNRANGVSNSIYLASGTLNLNAGNGGAIYFNDGIDSALSTNEININKNIASAPVDGNVNFNGTVNNATINLYNGATNLNSGGLFTQSQINLSGGSTNLNSGGSIANSTLDISGGSMNINSGGSITQSQMNLSGGVLNVTSGQLNTSNDIALIQGTMNLNASSGASTSIEDKIVSVNSANNININNSGAGTVYLNNTITNATLNMYNGTMSLAHDEYINGNNLNTQGGSISMINNSVGVAALNNLNLSDGTTTNLGIDVDLKNSVADKITASSIGIGTGMLSVNNINMLNGGEANNNSILLADANLRERVSLGMNKLVTPIYDYNLTYNPGTGAMGVTGGGINGSSFNPAVLNSTVQANTGNYLNQITSYQQAFYNMDSVMLLPSMVREETLNRNKYADSSGGPLVFSPIMQPEQSRGLWFRPYTTFENVPLNNGPTVSNIAYGALVGGDSDFTKLKNGFYGVATGYVGYNGSQQSYTGVNTSQNGGIVGLTGTVYKGNFFSALTANVGANSGQSTSSNGTDYFNMITAGLASKTGYNFELNRGKFIIQPSMLMSYTFANTFSYVNAAGVNITSDPINAFQLAPGVRFIANTKSGWQPYVGVSMVWNIMDQSRFYANDVALPSMSIKPYVEYGIGVQKHWGESFTGFAQAMIDNGGRNGVNLQLGFRWAF